MKRFSVDQYVVEDQYINYDNLLIANEISRWNGGEVTEGPCD